MKLEIKVNIIIYVRFTKGPAMAMYVLVNMFEVDSQLNTFLRLSW